MNLLTERTGIFNRRFFFIFFSSIYQCSRVPLQDVRLIQNCIIMHQLFAIFVLSSKTNLPTVEKNCFGSCCEDQTFDSLICWWVQLALIILRFYRILIEWRFGLERKNDQGIDNFSCCFLKWSYDWQNKNNKWKHLIDPFKNFNSYQKIKLLLRLVIGFLNQ